MADPIVPNFINGVGRLATDRYTYEKHVNGTEDRHQAGQIDLFPTVVIGSPKTNVQDAITAISTIIGTPPPDASTTVKGIVKLAGDIAGTAINVVVTRLQGKPVSTLTPALGDVLTWDGSIWKPQSILGSFTNLNVTGNTTLGTNSSNTLIVNAQASFTNNLIVNGNTTLGNANSDSTTVQGALTVSGGNVNITGTTGATLAATATVTINGALATVINGGTISLNSPAINVNSSGSLSMSSSGQTSILAAGGLFLNTSGNNIYLNSNTIINTPYGFTFSGNSALYIASGVNFTVNCPMIMSGYSKITKRYSNGPNSNSDIFPAQYDVFFAQNITGNRQWTINEAFGANLASIDFEVINYNSTYSVTVYTPLPSATPIVVVPPTMRAVIYRNGATWTLKYKNYVYT